MIPYDVRLIRDQRHRPSVVSTTFAAARSLRWALFTTMLIGLAALPTARAQLAAAVSDVCADSCCRTDVLLLNTGYDHIKGGLYPIGGYDPFWHVVSGATEGTADIIERERGTWADPQPGTQWVGTRGDPEGRPTTYEKCFCVCGPNATDLTFNLSILASGPGKVSIDGVAIGTLPAGGALTPTVITATVHLNPGVHCIEVEVEETLVYADGHGAQNGFDLQGTVVGPGLVKYTCCNTVIDGDCETPRLKIGTDNTWTLTSGAGPGTFPRAASVITTVYWPGAWGIPTPGSSWIGPNPQGNSNLAGDDYNYRKCFCMNQAGTVVITMTLAADDACDVYLDGFPIMTFVPNYRIPTTQTLIVALDAGCHCFDFLVDDLGGSITGLDALIDLQGSHISKPECCDCAGGGGDGEPRNGVNPRDGHAAGTPAGTEAHGTMLLAIPNPTNGATTIHYVLEKAGDASVELYDVSGRLVRSLDAGARTAGAHEIHLDATSLAAGSYFAVLNVGGKRFTVPISVR